MKKSRSVSLCLVKSISVAALAAGCGSTPPPSQQVCIDGARNVVEEQRCRDDAQRAQSGGYVPMYHWYYYPRSFGWTPIMGSPVPVGGSFSAPVASGWASIIRGGFGSTGAGEGTGS